MIKFSKIIFSVLMLVVLVLPFFVFAQTLPDPTIPVGGASLNLTEVQNIITTVARFLIVISLIIAVIFIIWGGMAYMMAGGDETKAGAARSRIFNGIIGAAVVLAVGVILQTLSGIIARTFFS